MKDNSAVCGNYAVVSCDGIIYNYNGGGAGVYNTGTLILEAGAVISNNTVNSPNNSGYFYNTGGGGVYNTGALTVGVGAKISENKVNIPGSGAKGAYFYCGGGGVYSYNGTITMTGGEISGNTDTTITDNYNGGGGVYSYNGTITMTGGEISDNTAIKGGGVYNFKLSTFTMSDGALISGNTAAYGAGVYNSATLTLRSGASISDNYAKNISPPGGGYGGGVYNIRTLSIYDGAEISNNRSDSYGGGVYSHGSTYVDGSSSVPMFTLFGGKINNNTVIASAGGGGVAVVSSGSSANVFTMSGGEISNNTGVSYGGAVYVYSKAGFDMTGGVLSGNTAGQGGAVYLYYNALFNMTGGEISGNTATYGGAVYNYYTSSFTMNGSAVISGNTATSYGGGIFSTSTSTFTMNGGEVSGNTAIYGGGAFNNATCTLTMNGGDVSGNIANNGGGIYNSSKLKITGGTISGNVAKLNNAAKNAAGGGIYTTDFANLTVSNGVVFSGNSAPTLRTLDIESNADVDSNGVYDLVDYAGIGDVVLGGPVLTSINAPAYNNYDINYPGDAYVVFVDIIPDGTGTITIASIDDSIQYGILTVDGCVYVPSTAGSIAFTAAPISGYVFEKFVIDGASEIKDLQTAVSISGNMSVTAEFVQKPAKPPVDPPISQHHIVASADDGSEISPSGIVKVSPGNGRAFTFSAKSGYVILAVYVDGKALSAEESAAGTYAFLNVKSNHTIKVVSKAESTVGPEDNGGGEKPEAGGEDLVGGSGEWSLMNLICAVIAFFVGIVAVIHGVKGRREEDDSVPADNERERSKSSMLFAAFSLIVGIASVIIFFLTEDWTLPVQFTDRYTLLMIVLLIVTVVLAVIGSRLNHKEDKQDL